MVWWLRRALLFALAASAGACSEPPPRVLPPPPGPASSWILAAVQADTPAERLQLTAVEDTTSAAHFIADTERTRLYAMGYQSSLARLGLAAGPLEHAQDCERHCELTRPDAQFVLEVDPAQAPGWTMLSAPDPAILDAVVPDRHKRCAEGCLSFRESSASLGTASDPYYLVAEAHDPGDPSIATSALMGLADGSLFRVRGPGEVERLCQRTGFLPYAAALEPGQSTLWIARDDNAIGWVDLAALDPEQPCPFTRTATLPAGARTLRLALLPGRDPPELYVLSSSGAISLLRSSVFKAIGMVALKEGDASTNSGFALPVEAAAFFGAGGDEIAVLREGRLSYHRKLAQSLGRGNADSALAYQGDVYIGVDTFNLFVSREGVGNIVPLNEGASRLESPWEDPEALAPLQGRIFVVLSRGMLGEWSQRTEYCHPQRVTADHVRSLMNIRGNLFLPDGDPANVPERLARWLEPERKEVCPP